LTFGKYRVIINIVVILQFKDENIMKLQFIRHNVLPIIAAFIWGMAFVAQSKCADLVEPFTMNAIRAIIAFGFLLVMFLAVRRMEEKNGHKKPIPWKQAIKGGTLCGIFLATATNLQQFGIIGTSAGKAGFITSCYIVFVPVLGIFVKKKCPLNVWISVIIAAFGLYFLCVKEGFKVAPSDVYVMICSVMFAIHIMVIDKYTAEVGGILLSMIQFLVVSVISAVFMLIFEKPDSVNIMKCMSSLVYLGIFSSGVAYTLQIIAMKGANPAVVSLLLSFESVFAAIGGALLLHEKLGVQELIGCALMFCAVILAQINFKKKISE